MIHFIHEIYNAIMQCYFNKIELKILFYYNKIVKNFS